jgi:hypothetical protein
MKFLWLLVSLLVGFPSQPEAAVVRTFQVGNWSGAAYASQSGSFSHCAAGMKFRSNITMLFSINKDFVWTLALHNAAWVFQSGQHVTLTLALDKTPPMKQRAEAFDRSGIIITLDDDADLFRRFKASKRIKISGVKETFEFELTRMNELFSRLLACVKQHQGPSDMPVAQNPFITTEQGGDEIVAEATAFAASLLSDAKISGYRFLAPDENKLLEGDARWIVPGSGLGSVRIFPDIGIDAQRTLSRQLVASNARACDGKFGSGLMPDDEKGSGGAFVICDLGEVTFVIYFFSIPRVAGGAYVVSTGYYGAAAPVQRAKEEHQKFREAVFSARREDASDSAGK